MPEINQNISKKEYDKFDLNVDAVLNQNSDACEQIKKLIQSKFDSFIKLSFEDYRTLKFINNSTYFFENDRDHIKNGFNLTPSANEAFKKLILSMPETSKKHLLAKYGHKALVDLTKSKESLNQTFDDALILHSFDLFYKNLCNIHLKQLISAKIVLALNREAGNLPSYTIPDEFITSVKTQELGVKAEDLIDYIIEKNISKYQLPLNERYLREFAKCLCSYKFREDAAYEINFLNKLKKEAISYDHWADRPHLDEKDVITDTDMLLTNGETTVELINNLKKLVNITPCSELEPLTKLKNSEEIHSIAYDVCRDGKDDKKISFLRKVTKFFRDHFLSHGRKETIMADLDLENKKCRFLSLKQLKVHFAVCKNTYANFIFNNGFQEVFNKPIVVENNVCLNRYQLAEISTIPLEKIKLSPLNKNVTENIDALRKECQKEYTKIIYEELNKRFTNNTSLLKKDVSLTFEDVADKVIAKYDQDIEAFTKEDQFELINKIRKDTLNLAQEEGIGSIPYVIETQKFRNKSLSDLPKQAFKELVYEDISYNHRNILKNALICVENKDLVEQYSKDRPDLIKTYKKDQFINSFLENLSNDMLQLEQYRQKFDVNKFADSYKSQRESEFFGYRQEFARSRVLDRVTNESRKSIHL